MADEDHLKVIARELVKIRELTSKAVNAIGTAETEVPEMMRRFTMYMVDIHTIVHLYEERGLSAPDYVLREMERCDDRLKHLLTDLHTDGGAFEKVRREMTERGGNRWDHTRQLFGPVKETPNETRIK
jgi:hypothetical protein